MKKRKLLALLCALAVGATTVLPVYAVGQEQVSEQPDQQAAAVAETDISFTAPDGLDQLTNIALGCAVTSAPEITSTHPATDATDGEYDTNLNERGGSFAQLGDTAEGTEWNLTVDLGAVKSFSTVKLDKLNLNGSTTNNLQDYQILISEDGTDWTQLGTAEHEDTSNDKAVYFTPKEQAAARYVRVYVPAEGVGTGWKAVDEIEVYAEPAEPADPEIDYTLYDNLALNGEASISETEYSGHPASAAIDGNLSSYAQADNGQAFDLIVKLEEPVTMNTAIMKWYGFGSLNQPHRVKGFTIYTSMDGTEWAKAAEKTLTDQELRADAVVTFDPVEAAYMKFEMNDYEEWMAVNELELYDTSRLPGVSTNFASGSTVKKGSEIRLSAPYDSTVYYTLDGSDPTKSDTKIEYTEPIIADDDLTIKAYAEKEGYKNSEVSTFTYLLQWVETDPAPGRVDPGTKVNLTTHLSDADILYTTDGTDPQDSETAETYKDPIEIKEYTRLNICAKNEERTTPTYEFVYSTENIAEGKTLSASSGDASLAVDGDDETMWQTDANGWLKIDFGEFYDFGNVSILWADANANYKYMVETSSDNYSWHTYISNPTGNNPDQEHILPNQETHWRYMRVRVLGAESGKTLGIREIEVAGEKSAEIPEIPMYDDESELYDRVVVNPIPKKVNGVEDNKISLNGEWNFTMYPQNAFWKDNTDLSNWDKAEIPGDLDAEGFPVYDMENPDWTGGYGNAKFYPGNNAEMVYKTQVEVPADYEGQKVFLRVDKAFSYARVWVNGQFVREHRGEYNTWDADITDYVKPGEKNWITLAITAEGSYDDEGTLISFVGLRSIRGVLGNVSMYAAPETYLNRLHVETDLDEEYKDAELTIMTNTFLGDAEDAEIQLTLTDPDGEKVKLSQDTIGLTAADNFKDKNITVNIEDPAKWDPEHPNLYTLTAKLKADGKTVETVSKRIGFREITIEDSVFKVNGVATKLRGVNYHTVYGNDGIAYDYETEKELLETAKRNNVNYIRAAHYPLSTETLELCDELGLFVEQENSMCFGDPNNMKPTAHWHPFYETYLLHACSEMVEKDRSHPSIVMWSIANESAWGENHAKTSQYIKDVNPSIPVKFSWGDQIPAGAAVDIKSNHYKMNGGSYDGMPVVWDEFAHDYSHGNEGHMRFDPGLRENYYQIIKQNWEEIYAEDTALGGAIWCYTDNAYEGENRVDGNSNWGQIDAWGREKPEIWATRNVYSPVQYKGEDAVSVPGRSKDLVLRYENRYETVDFGDSDFEILYSVNGGEETGVSAELAPKETGDIMLPAPEEGWNKGDTVTVEFYKTTNGVRRNVMTHVVTLGSPVYTFPEATGTAPEITEDETAIHVAGDNFSIDFSKETGMITEGVVNETTILTGGPYLNLGMTDPGTWTLNTITAEEQEGAAVVTIDGTYSNSAVAGCTFTLKIDSAGQVETTYAVKNPGSVSDYEVGVAYDLPETAETISWIRDGYLSYYPDDQLGRLEGTAVKEHDDWEREWGVKPTKPWKEDDKDFYNFGRDDEGGRGTNDFRASKTGVYYAEMGLDGTESVLSVYGDGQGSVRAALNGDKTVRLNINNEWGYPVNGLSGISQKAATAAAGYTNTVTMQLAESGDNYTVEYGEVPEPEFIKAESATSGSNYNPAYTPDNNIINNSGMSSDIELDALHDNESGAVTMWHTKENPGENAWIQVDLGKVYSLDEMWVWNHNQYAESNPTLIDRGLKNVKIEYSEDGETWTELTTDMVFEDGDEEYPFQLAKATGENGQKATNLNDGNNTPISFNGANARYVKITANPEPGNGSWGAAYYGLSEVRFTKMADKSDLETLYNECKDLDQTKYTEETWKPFAEAMEAAKAVLDDPDATQAEVDEAYNALKDAKEGLKLKEDENNPGGGDPGDNPGGGDPGDNPDGGDPGENPGEKPDDNPDGQNPGKGDTTEDGNGDSAPVTGVSAPLAELLGLALIAGGTAAAVLWRRQKR